MSRAPGGPGSTDRRLRVAPQTISLCVLAAFGTAVAVALLSPASAPDRAAVSAVALLVAGLSVAVTGAWAARRNTGLRRLGWSLISAAAVVAMLGNVLTGQGGNSAGGQATASITSDISIATALTLVVIGTACLPQNRWRGRELITVLLDGILVVAAVLVMASSLVYSDLLTAAPDGLLNQATAVLIPVIDAVLGTVAVVLFLRSRGSDRRVMALVAVGSTLYALADLRYAVLLAEGRFGFGTWTDLGWILGYLALAAAAVFGTRPADDGTAPQRSLGTDVAGTVTIFAMLLIAGVVQILVPARDDVRNAQALLWLVLILAAALRQAILGRENHSLRRGLERRVDEQTADLRRMVRQTGVLVDSVGDGIYGVDGEGRVTFMNRSGQVLLGLDSLEQVLGRHAHDAFHGRRGDGTAYPRSGCYVTEAIEQGVLAVGEDDDYLRLDGTLLSVEITASPLVDEESGVSSGAVVVFRDATQRREMERIKEEFLSVVSHELRTPLTSIRGSLGLLSGGALGVLPPQAAKVASLAEDSSERLARMINDMLDLERLTTGTVVLELETVPAQELLATVVAELSGLSRIHDIRIAVGPVAGAAVVDGDRFVQVMTNLVGNAMKFSRPGDVVHLAARPQDGELLVEVRDTGRGIPPEQLEQIFERFHQVDSSDSRQKGGTGLGLAISRELIDRMGGRIWADSVVGEGTTFWFTLPLAPSTVSPDTSPDPEHHPQEDPRAEYEPR